MLMPLMKDAMDAKPCEMKCVLRFRWMVSIHRPLGYEPNALTSAPHRTDTWGGFREKHWDVIWVNYDSSTIQAKWASIPHHSSAPWMNQHRTRKKKAHNDCLYMWACRNFLPFNTNARGPPPLFNPQNPHLSKFSNCANVNSPCHRTNAPSITRHAPHCLNTTSVGWSGLLHCPSSPVPHCLVVPHLSSWTQITEPTGCASLVRLVDSIRLGFIVSALEPRLACDQHIHHHVMIPTCHKAV